MTEGGRAPDVTVEFTDEGAETVPRARPPWRRFASSAAALMLVLAAGIGIGYESTRTRTPVPDPVVTSDDGPAEVRATGTRCLQSTDTGLWLGAEFVNRGPGTALLRGARVELPLGGLALTSLVWGPCGQTDAPPAHAPDQVWLGFVAVPEHQRAWISAIVEVVNVDECPEPYPMLFHVSYIDRTGHITDVEFGFVDLGGVPYPACGPEA